MRAHMIATGLALAIAACAPGTYIPAAHSIAEFEAGLESLRVRYHIPGMSGIVDGDNGTVWMKAVMALLSLLTMPTTTPGS